MEEPKVKSKEPSLYGSDWNGKDIMKDDTNDINIMSKHVGEAIK